MNSQTTKLVLEVEEIERQERGSGSCTSSSTSRLCTCRCIYPSTGSSREGS